MRIRGRRIGTILYPSTAATNKSVSEFRGNTIEVTEVCERGERGGSASPRLAYLNLGVISMVISATTCRFVRYSKLKVSV